MLLGTGGLLVGLAIACVAMATAMTYSFRGTLDRSADATIPRSRAAGEGGTLPSPLPAPAGQVVQVLDGSTGSSPATATPTCSPALHDDEVPRPWTGGSPSPRPGAAAGPVRVTARRVEDGRIVVVAVPLGDYNRSLRAAARRRCG